MMLRRRRCCYIEVGKLKSCFLVLVCSATLTSAQAGRVTAGLLNVAYKCCISAASEQMMKQRSLNKKTSVIA